MDFLINSFKQSNISLKELKCLLSLYKKNKLKEFMNEYDKFRNNNKDFFSNMQNLPLPSINSPFLKKVNNFFKRIMVKIGEKIKLFLIQLSQDPTFISLDTEFINNPSQTSYNNLTTYVQLKNDEFIETLNLNNEFKITLSMMSDDRIPMYNEDEKRKNTYEDMIKGNIKFNSKDEYVSGIKSTITGEYEKYYPLQGIIISYKVGQTVIEKLETSSPGGGVGILVLGITILAFAVQFLFTSKFPEDKYIAGFFILVGLFLIIIGIIVMANSSSSSSS
jgi:hypothetical protein